MKAKILAGAVGTILLTASVVVGFLQHAAFISQNSNHRARRHSLSQVVVASAGSSGADDLSSLLQIARSEFGVGAAKSASTIGDVSISVASTPKAVINDPLKDILLATQANLQQSEYIPLDDGKTLPLGTFIKASVNGNAPMPSGGTDWETSRANLELLKANTLKMTGADPNNYPTINFPKFSAPDFDVDASAIQQYIESLPPGAKTFAAVAAGATLVLVGASNNKKTASKKKAAAPASNADIKATSDVVGGLTDELGTLQSRMKALEATGLNLDSQLTDARSKLTEKELDISKARLKAADASLNLNREIDMLKQKLKSNDGKVLTLDDELTKARKECVGLVKELEKSRKEQAKKEAAEAAKLAKTKKAVEAAKKVDEAVKKKADEAAKKAGVAAKKADDAAKKADAAATKKADAAATKKADEAAKKADAAATKKADEAAKKADIASSKKALEASLKALEAAKKADEATKKKVAAKPAIEKKVSVKKAAPKKSQTPVEKIAPKKAAAPKKVASKAKDEEKVSGTGVWTAAEEKIEEVPTADAPSVTKAKPQQKKGDLTTLTKSGLDRTTVKVLVEFLGSKGITTVGENGKTLKKSDLLEAVRSL